MLPMDVDQILANLYLGSYPQTTADLDTLRAKGISAVLNLQTDSDFDYLGVDWPSHRAHYSSLGLEARRVPIRDFDDAHLHRQLHEAASALHELIDRGHTVYVHCSGGVNRSPSVVIAYLYWFADWPLEDATDHVRQRHPCAPVMDVVRAAISDQRRW